MDVFRRLHFMRGVYLNEFSADLRVDCELPWQKASDRRWSDHDTIMLIEWLQNNDLPFSKNTVVDCVPSHGQVNSRHPLRDWLNGLEWDGIPRTEMWLTYYLGANDNEFTRAVAKAWLISAVARVMEPGCKVDHMIVLEGTQGIGKSTALKILAGEEYFTDEIPDLGSADASMQLSGTWILEIAEMAGITKAKIEVTKSFITRTTDKFRPPYGRNPIIKPRQSIFAGTTNSDRYLGDVDNRRYWPIMTRSIDTRALQADRNQLWAETVFRYNNGEKWWISDEHTRLLAQEAQDDRRANDPWEEKIDKYLEGRDDVSIQEILERALGIAVKDWDVAVSTRVGLRLQMLRTWERYRHTDPGTKLRSYRHRLKR